MDVTIDNFGEIRELIERKLLPQVQHAISRQDISVSISSLRVSDTKSFRGITLITSPSKNTKK